MSMILARKLAEGVGGWLQYEYQCNRSGVFSEKYLSVPVAGILSSLYGRKVFAEVKHPILAPAVSGPGRRPEIDFAVLDPHPEMKVAIESKWVGKGSISVESIIWDVIRLEMIAHYCGARCFFLLGGKRRSLDALFRSTSFTGPDKTKRRTQRPVLRTDRNIICTLGIDSTFECRRAIIKRLMKSHQQTRIPCRVISVRTNPFPNPCQSNQYQVYVWEILTRQKNRREFLPAKHKHYAD